MDLTKALDEMKRVKDFLSAVTITEETMRTIGALGDEVAVLGKKKVVLEEEIKRLSTEYEAAKKSHDSGMRGIAAETEKARGELLSVMKEIHAAKKTFGKEVESHASEISRARKEHSVELARMREEIASEQAKLDHVRGAIKQISGIAG